MLDNITRKDLLITALEGGSNYWYDLPFIEMVEKPNDIYTMSERIFQAVCKGVEIPVHDIETGEKLGELSMRNIRRGERTMKAEYPTTHWKDIQYGDWDATTADVWFQFIVMNEIVFG